MKFLSTYRKFHNQLLYRMSVFFVLVMFFPFYSRAFAQVEDNSWSQPLKIGSFDIFPSNPNPTVISDSEGWLHVFWVNKTKPDRDSVIMYTCWNGIDWSKPIDVLLSPDTNRITKRPRAIVDNFGRLQVIWESQNGNLYHSSAPAHQATSAKAWTIPEAIAPFPATGHNLTIDIFGRLHAIFLDRETQSPYYISTDDQAKVWSKPVLIAQFNLKEANAEPSISSIVVDGKAQIHVAWRRGENTLDYYARSEDGGVTWTEPQELGTPLGSEVIYHNSPTLAAVGEDEIHLVWLAVYSLREDGSLVAHSRYHQWSQDGGKTWTKMKLIFPDIFGHNGPNSLVVDSSESLHQLTVGGIGPGAVHWVEYSQWTGSQWKTVEVIPGSRRLDWGKEGPSGSDMTVTLGNKLDVVWETRDGDIWYSRRDISAPPLVSRPVQSPEQQTLLEKAVVEPSIFPVEDPIFQNSIKVIVPSVRSLPSPSLILIALAPVTAFWAILLIIKRLNLKR